MKEFWPLFDTLKFLSIKFQILDVLNDDLPVTPPKWRFSPRKKEVSDGAHAPHVRGSAGKLAIHDLRCHELQCPAHGHLEF